MTQTIFYLEDRGNVILYHFFIYMLGGLYYIENKQYDIKGKDSLQISSNKIVKYPTKIITYPITIYITPFLILNAH